MPTIQLSLILPFLLFTSVVSASIKNCPPSKPDFDITHNTLIDLYEKQTELVAKTIK